MITKPIKTAKVIEKGSVCKFILESLENAKKTFENPDLKSVFEGAILVISGKIISILEGNTVDLSQISFEDLVKKEAGSIIRSVKGCYLTEKDSTLIPNAGIDVSNIQQGKAVLWPKNAKKTAQIIRQAIVEQYELENFGVIISDSMVVPRRKGTVGLALGSCGFEAVIDERGKKDVFGNTLKLTQRAFADNLATSANVVMGEGNECTPLVLIQNSPALFNKKATSSLTSTAISESEDLFN